MSQTNLPELVQQISVARAGVQQLAECDRQLREAHAGACQARARLEDSLEPPEKIIANMIALVDEAAARYATEHGDSIIAAFSGHLEAQSDGTLQERKPRLYDHYLHDLTFRDLCGLAPALVKARLTEIIRGHEYEAGPALSERGVALEAAKERIRQIEDEHTKLVDAAAALDPPIMFELLPAVRERRLQEAARRQRERDAEEAQREAEARLNQSRAARRAQPRCGVSEYLTQNARGPFDEPRDIRVP